MDEAVRFNKIKNIAYSTAIQNCCKPYGSPWNNDRYVSALG
jgi:hypothetical protein